MATIYTYQDLLAVGNNERERKEFVRRAINGHKSSEDYRIAADAYQYYVHKNVTINNFQKLLCKVTGEVVPDTYSANFKMACNHYRRFITQEVQYLLGNGVSWNNEDTGEALGKGRKSFDRQVKSAAQKARWGKVAFGFYDLDHVEVFSYLEFVPLFDEMDGSLKAGIRFWQIASNKPLRATLYEIDGFTKYVYKKDKESTVDDEKKRGYVRKIVSTEADGEEIYDEQNYPTFPVVPLWGSDDHQSSLIGLQEQIDCYDLIKSGFANTVDDASIIYWTLKNAGGMDDVDLAQFIERIKTVHAFNLDDEVEATPTTIDAPADGREKLLDRLDKDLYKDAMALDTERIAGGAVTATQIIAAYEDLNSKCDDFEYQILDFIEGILAIAGIEDEPTFTRSQIINREEMINIILSAAEYLPEEYVTTKILEILGDGDKAKKLLGDLELEQRGRFTADNEDDENDIDEEIEE